MEDDVDSVHISVEIVHFVMNFMLREFNFLPDRIMSTVT